ncbi:agmatinase [Aeropyrum camini]|uniref:agmatinase n=1 Tax=Aeropyrum camini TaxID=229980 RepID=UPI0007890E87|nr:agmatinase [Aeropyrum camini]
MEGGPRARDLYLQRPPEPVFGIQRSREESLFSVVGVPFDSTSSYRPGQRFAPREIRLASLELESNGYYVEGDIDRVPIADEGDVAAVPGSALLTLERVARVVEDLAREGKVPVVLGGEHLVTLGVLRGLAAAGLRPCVIVLDAHFDLRNDYLGERFSHATVFRRTVEELGLKLLYIGVRAYEKSEEVLASESGLIEYVPMGRLDIIGVEGAVLAARRFAGGCDRIYISIDMDFYDPAYAPGAATPSPAGPAVGRA